MRSTQSEGVGFTGEALARLASSAPPQSTTTAWSRPPATTWEPTTLTPWPPAATSPTDRVRRGMRAGPQPSAHSCWTTWTDIGRQSGQEIDGLACVPVDRRDPDAETRCEAGVGVAAAQVGQDEQGLPTAGQATPPGVEPTAVTCKETGEMLQGAAGRIDTGRVDKRAKVPGGLVILVVNPSTRSSSSWPVRPLTLPSFVSVRCAWLRRSAPTTQPSGPR